MDQHQNRLSQKRQNFRKEIRRQKLQQKFRKIRTQLFQQNQTNVQNEQLKAKVLQTIQLITARNYYFPNNEGSEENDKLRDSKIEYLMNLPERQLCEPDLELRKIVQHQTMKNKINERWSIIYQWQQICGDIVQNIIISISKSWSAYSYRIEILQFILQTIEFLNYGHKVRQLKRISTKQIDQKYLVGQPQKYYRSILRKYCQNLLTNFTATEDESILLPFVSKISKIIKSNSDFVMIYHNLFLTNHIPIGQKLSIFKDFIEFLELNSSSLRDHDTQLIKILYLAYGNQPNIIKVNFNSYLKSIELNYRCLNILQNYLGAFNFKIQECYSEDPHKQQYATILETCLILECIFKEQESLIANVPQKQKIFKFLMNRIKKSKAVPQIKCVYYVLKSLGNLSFHTNIYLQISYTFPLLDIEIFRVFDKFYKQLFEESGIQQEGSKLSSQMGRLQLQCIKQIVKIVRLSSINQQTCFKYIKSGLVKKLMKICRFWTRNKGIKSLRLTKDSCMQIFCLIIQSLLRYSFHESQFQIEYQPVDILIGEFFFTEEYQNGNIVSLIETELIQIGGKGETYNPILIEIILQMLGNIFGRIFSQIEWQISQNLSQCQNSSTQKDYGLQRNKWFMIYKQYVQKSEIIKLLNQILYDNNLKFIVGNSNIQDKISQILQILDKIDQTIRIDRNHNSVIQLEK